MVCLPSPALKKSRFEDIPYSNYLLLSKNCRHEVSNSISSLESTITDTISLDGSSESKSSRSVMDEVELKILSVLEGHFESPGFSNSTKFRHAVQRQKIISHKSSNGIVYEPAWDSDSDLKAKCIYTQSVADWDWLSGQVFHVRWWSKGLGRFCKWDRGMKFWTFEELQEAHREHLAGTNGPVHHDWCFLDGTMQWDMFWSAALLFKYTGSSGIKSWDDQFQDLKVQAQQ